MEIQLEEQDAILLQKQQEIITKYLKNKKILLDKALNKYGIEAIFHILIQQIK